MSSHIRLGVNIDHVATVRNARGTTYPCPVRAAIIAEKAGADGITAHLREDRRHISDQDILDLLAHLTKPLNLEMAATDEMRNIALMHKPHAICLVPEKRSEKTTEGGLNIKDHYDFFNDYIHAFKTIKSRISLFIDPEIDQIDAALALNVPVVEFHTGDYCHSILAKDAEWSQKAYQKLYSAAQYAGENGLEIHAGHGLTYQTIHKIAQLPYLKELNIGHFIIGEAIFVGLEQVIHQVKQHIQAASIT